jgi:pre-mRNA-splicing helicase BRR2
MGQSDIIISTPDKYEILSRKWKVRKVVQRVSLYILDEIQMIPDQNSTYEVLASRIRYIQNQVEGKTIRIVAIGCPIANSKDVASWLGI